MPAIVEDGSSAVSYAGGWSVVTGSSSDYSGGAVHSSSSSGSTATIRFSGTSITVFGTNPGAQTHGAHLYASFILDGVESSWDRTVHGTAYYKDPFWGSGHLSEGTHTLVVRNTGSSPAFILDYFEIEGSALNQVNPPPPPPTTTTRSLDPTPTVSTSVLTQTSTLTVSGSGSTATETLTSSGLTVTNSLLSTTTQTTSTSSRSNSTSGVVSQSLSVDPETGQTVTAFQVVTTSISGAPAHITLYPDGNGGFDASGAASKGGVPIGAIVGAVVGSLLFLIFVILFVILFLRRRKRAVALTEALENARAVPMSENGPSPSLSHRISESLRPAIASKFRGQQTGGDNRPFQRLDEESSTSQSGSGSGYGGDPAPMLALNLYPNEKGTSSFMDPFGAGSSNTSYPSPIVSNASAFEGTAHDPDEAPPAYSNRHSNIPPPVGSGVAR